MPILITLVENGTTHAFEYDGDHEFKIGRGPRCKIVLETSKASRYHASIVREHESFFLIDNGSRNGTYLNGVKVTRCRVDEGDVIQIGRAVITFGADPKSDSPPPTAENEDHPPEIAHDRVDNPPKEKSTPKPSSTEASPAAVLTLLALGAVIGVIVLLNSGSKGNRDGNGDEIAEKNQTATLLVDTVDPVILQPDAVPETSESGVGTPTEISKPVDVEEPARTEDSTIAEPLLDPLPPVEDSESVDTTNQTAEDPSINPAALLTALLRDASRHARGHDIVAELREVVDRYPGHPAADQAREIMTIIADVKTGINESHRNELKAIIDGLQSRRRFGDAVRFARILAEHEALENGFVWQRAADDLEVLARAEYRELEKEIEAFIEGNQPVAAFDTLKKARSQFGGTAFFDRTVNDHLGSLFSTPASDPDHKPDVERIQLQDRAAVAFENCQFADIGINYWSMLAHDISEDDRLGAMEWIVKGSYLTRMLNDFLERSKGIVIEISPLQGFIGRTLGANKDEVEFELDIDGRRGAYHDTIEWGRISYLQKTRLFESIALSASGSLGLVLFCFQAGNEEGAHRALLRLHKSDSSREMADAVLAWHSGEPVPEGGFVEYRSRLVSPVFREIEIAAAATLKREEKEAREELRRVKKGAILGRYLDVVREYRDAGRFRLAQTILESLARHFPETDVGREAQLLLDNPVLLIRPLRSHGPSTNRFDLHVLAEGYQGDDRSQEAFFNTATGAINLLFTHEPYREYESFFNVHAVHLLSQDAGVDRNPGGVEKDSALDGKVEWDAFIVSRKKTRELLKRVTPDTFDGLSIVIGNDSAGVATGGRGIASVAKTSLGALAHELGHAIGNLHDEYAYAPGTRPDRNAHLNNDPRASTRPMPPNLMYGSDRTDLIAKAVWKPWIEAGRSRWWNGMDVSVYLGGNRTPFNTWRPQPNCKMRTSSAPFCVVCMETMVKNIYKHVKPIDEVEPSKKKIDLYEFDVIDVRAFTLRPRTHYLKSSWKLHILPPRDGDPIEPEEGAVRTPTRVPLKKIYRHRIPDNRMLEGVLLRGLDLKAGRYRLALTVSDPTPWILDSLRQTLAQTHQWIVQVHPGPRPEEAPDEDK
jgi:pSer/pThr/pTyr-binding forkhead associated (FHA) protein